MDEILEETISSATNNEDDENVNQILMQSELEKHEEDFLNSAIKLSLEQQQPNSDTNTNQNPSQQQLNNNEIDYYSIPSIQTALEFGFSLEDAILAYSLYGDSSDLMLQYLYSLNLSHFNN